MEVLAETTDQTEADTLEAQYIRWTPQWAKLNRSFRPRQKTPAPPVNGRYRCSWCQLDWPVELMANNRHRSRGVDSKCKECYRAYQRVVDYLRRNGGEGETAGVDYSFAYRYARGMMAAGCWSATRIRGGSLPKVMADHRQTLEKADTPQWVADWAMFQQPAVEAADGSGREDKHMSNKQQKKKLLTHRMLEQSAGGMAV